MRRKSPIHLNQNNLISCAYFFILIFLVAFWLHYHSSSMQVVND